MKPVTNSHYFVCKKWALNSPGVQIVGIKPLALDCLATAQNNLIQVRLATGGEQTLGALTLGVSVVIGTRYDEHQDRHGGINGEVD